MKEIKKLNKFYILDNRGENVKKILIVVLVLFLMACSAESESYKRIVKIVEGYNNLAIIEIDLAQARFAETTKDRMWYENISISSNDKHSFIDISDEIYEVEEEMLKVKFDTFVKVFLPNITETELRIVWNELKRGDYEYYEKYNYKNLELGLSISPLIDSEKKRYSIKIEFPNKFIKKN